VAFTGSTSSGSIDGGKDVTAATTPILLYDGTCGVCARSIQFVLRNEPPNGQLRFARLEGSIGTELRGRHPELLAVDSVLWFEPATPTSPERLLARSGAALRVAGYLGGGWRLLASLGAAVPAPLRDAAYDWIARHRRQLAPEACLVPTPAQGRRFID
jgi:predicted DCC family thiol-disulfide oxidoreductase YuxK